MKNLKAAAFLSLLLASTHAQAALELPPLFADGMVLQRERPVRIWGWAVPAASIRVELDGRSASAVADGDGRWEAQLPAHAAGGPFRLRIEGDGQTRVLQDVLIGDVWLCSGQSNMEFTVAEANNAAAEIAAARDPQIRHFKVPKSWAGRPDDRLAGGAWEAASPQTVGAFTAVGYYFARDLRAKTGVPIGLIDATWGGSSIEAWTDARTLGLDTAAFEADLRAQTARDRRTLEEVRARIARWPSGRGIVEGKPLWAAPDFDDTGWAAIAVPALWEEAGWPGMNGVAWYRTVFELDAAEAAAGVVIGVGMIDDNDETFVNGRRVGGMTMGWNKARAYEVPASVLRAGSNTLAVRVEDTGGGGGIAGDADLVYVQPRGGARRPLAKTWKFRTEAVQLSLDDDKNVRPALLYNKMIHPLLRYPIEGVLWYQGEANAQPGFARPYRDRFTAMIRRWRQLWGEGDFPFLWVQLANFAPDGGDGRGAWALLRESQSAALKLPNTAQAVTIDIGDPDDIHPRNKQEVGRRLALVARHVAYGEGLVYTGPTYRDLRIDDATAVLSFDLHGSSLSARGGGNSVRGFEVADADRRFVAATATLAGDTVRVSSDAVPHPVAVRYAWSDNPESANLINTEGLPASPFRTDDW